MNLPETICASAMDLYNQVQNEANSRFKSWEHCHLEFVTAKNTGVCDSNHLSLHLAFYLASWGMYRGSTFLLKKDYQVHIPVVQELFQEKYHPLFGIDCADLCKGENQGLLQEISQFLAEYYDKIRLETKGAPTKKNLSDTLITKILLGCFACVPAYDQYFVDALRSQKVATGTYTMYSITKLCEFYASNEALFEETRRNMVVGDLLYSQMKFLDMGFWNMGNFIAT